MEPIKYAFISHRNVEPDLGITSRLYEHLTKLKLEAWYDKKLKGGDWPQQISEKLRKATVYVLITSRESLTSQEVLDEIGMMRSERNKNGKKLILYIIDDYYFNLEAGTADYFLGSNRNQSVKLSDYPDETAAFDALVKYLREDLVEFDNNPADFIYDSSGEILTQYIGHDEIVTVPESVTEIGELAFSGKKELSKVIIPPSVKRIKRMAFLGCENLIQVDGMEGVESCDKSSFQDTGLVINEETDYSVNGVVFGAKAEGDELIIPQGIRVISSLAFRCNLAERIVLPEGLEHIGGGAFRECVNLKEIELPSTLKSLGNKAFCGCLKLKKVVLNGKRPFNTEGAFDNMNIIIEGNK